MKPTLTLEQTGKVYHLPFEKNVLIGRNPGCDIPIFSQSLEGVAQTTKREKLKELTDFISGTHVKVKFNMTGYLEVIDDISTNGTYLQDREEEGMSYLPGKSSANSLDSSGILLSGGRIILARDEDSSAKISLRYDAGV
jgi:hypothetical protein